MMNASDAIQTSMKRACAETSDLPALDLLGRMLGESPDGEAWFDAQGYVTWANATMVRLLGRQPETLAAFPSVVVFEADRPRFELMCAQTLESRQSAQIQLRLVRQDPAIVWASVTWQPLWDDADQFLGTRVSIRDTAMVGRTGSSPRDHLLNLRRQAVRITRESSGLGHDLTTLCNHIVAEASATLALPRVGVWLFSADRTRLECVTLYRSDRGEHVGGEHIMVDRYPIYMDAISTDEMVVAIDACAHAFTAELADSYLRPLGIASMLDAPIQLGGRTVGVLCMEHGPRLREWSSAEIAFADALAQHVGLFLEAQEQARLQSLNTRLASIIETTPDLVFTVTLQGDVVYVNQSGRRLMGVPAEAKLVGHNAMDFVPPELLLHRREYIIPTALKHGSWEGEVVMLTLQGERIPAWEYFVAHQGPDGHVTHFSAVIRDLRPQKLNEAAILQREEALRRLNEELEQRVMERTRKIEDINRNLETFAFSVSHDLKAPLRGIDGYSRLLLEEYRASLPEQAQGFLDNVRQAAQSMSDLIDDLLAYSRVGRREVSCSRLSLRAVLQRVLAERAHDLETNKVHLIDDVADIELNTDLECLLQILRNLIDNAIKFTRNASPPTIHLHNEFCGKHLIVGVKDNGCGFDMKYHDRIFSIFQRLHRAADYPGTGVGLAIVSKAAERLGGRVWADSAAGQGAAFFLELPSAAATSGLLRP